ncbi:MBL fold metallo-hydrolase [Rubrobacter indicoceani]|uniref:MBL fold metallo-hydrolase n=1 Tax=Rubrobacter indicoceani TaxID=2051957 RepID=UPI0013C467F8|nr:MBL fold metallo-hydrolase [Rubrobacter indicoceani]
MRFSVLASGSSGNATYVEANREPGGILVDCGVPARRLEPLLNSIGRGAGDVNAVLLTHGHSDHTCGLRTLRKVRPVPVFAAPGVGERFGAQTVETGDAFALPGILASFFEVPHDAPTCGVRLDSGEAAMAMATDLGEVRAGLLSVLRGVDALVVEANHDVEWLRNGRYPQQLKHRIASAEGHLSNDQAADLVLSLVPHGLKEVVLAHLSETNNSPARAVGAVSRVLREANFAGVRVRAALRKHPTPWIEVGRPPGPSEPLRFVYGEARPVGGLFGVTEEREEGGRL